ncbi:MAG TPA: hypothetical protein VEC12_15640 [Bacteroidia bacterium]|nr:hypothetical protein [Bacteroidia bacterium]
MGLFDFLKSKRIKFEHPYFGTIHFQKMKNSKNGGFFEGKKHFRPLNCEFDILIDCPETGPSNEYITFFEELEKNYSVLIKEISKKIQSDFFDNFDNRKIVIKEFGREFTLENISLPNLFETPYSWSLTYTSVHDENHFFEVFFKDWEIYDVMIDG